MGEAEKLGAAPNPVGAESKYEMVPTFYRVSGTFRKADPTLEQRMIRINPMRAGADTILDIIKTSVKRVRQCLQNRQETKIGLISTAFTLHQSGTILPDSYLIDVDAFCANGRKILEEARKHNFRMYFMLKQVGRNPYPGTETHRDGL